MIKRQSPSLGSHRCGGLPRSYRLRLWWPVSRWGHGSLCPRQFPWRNPVVSSPPPSFRKLDIRLFLAFRLCLFAYTLFGKADIHNLRFRLYLGYFQLLDVAGKRSCVTENPLSSSFFKQFFLITYHFRLYNTANGIQSFLLCTHVVYLCKTGCKYKEYCWINIQSRVFFSDISRG